VIRETATRLVRLSPQLRSLRAGLVLPWEATRLVVRTPVLMLFAALPIALTLVLYYFVIAELTDLIQTVVSGWFVTFGLDAGGLIVRALDLMTALVLALVAAVTFAFTASIIASPFNDLLAERAKRYAAPALSAAPEHTPRQQLTLIWIDLLKAAAAGFGAFFALLVVWIPFVNAVSFGVAFILVSFQYLSYPQTRRGIGLGGGLLFLWRHAWACAGFGATISFLFAIPLVQSLALPVAVVGGTLLAARAPGGEGFERLR
jgi:CysZ protein